MIKLNLYNSKDKKIVGNLNSVNSKSIVILAHGFTNDKSSDGRFDKLVEKLISDGSDTLAIDFSGSGESDDAPLTLENQEDDLRTFINYVLDNKYKSISLIGNSFGTLSCLKCYRNEINTMVLIGALTGKMKYKWEEIFSKENLIMLHEKDSFVLNDGRKHIINNQTLKDFEEINQDEILKNIGCPVLMIHGDNKDDLEERELLENSKNALKKLPEGSKIEIIRDGKHGFHNHWDEVMCLTCDWIKEKA